MDDEHEHIRLMIPEEVARLMKDRLIFRQHLQKAIHHAETTGEKFVNRSTGRSLASFRPDRVTYWVEYSPIGNDYLVHTAYLHRMEMKRGRGP
jgi:hypothetical protein